MSIGSRPARGGRLGRAVAVEIGWRLPLVAVAVIACYRLDWAWLRYLDSEAALRLATLRGYEAVRLSPHLIAWKDQGFEYGIACTFADVFCGAVPLLWMRGAGVPRNLRLLTLFAVALFAFNLCRGGITALIFSAGVPWTFADNLLGGLSYFAVWVVLVRHLERNVAARSETALTASAVVP